MEKKIIAISEEEFAAIVLAEKGSGKIDKILNVFAALPNSDLMATLLAILMAEIKFELFSDKYVIGTKGKTAEAKSFNRR